MYTTTPTKVKYTNSWFPMVLVVYMNMHKDVTKRATLNIWIVA